ncbi:hypothetical protein V2A60_006367 [Cordyceps javanica]
MKTLSFILALAAPGVMASPLPAEQGTPTALSTVPTSTPKAEAYVWNEGWHAEIPIHSSCNSTLRAQLRSALDDAVKLAQHARDHLLRFGSKSEFVQRYFGNATLTEAIGLYDHIIAGDKGAMTFRCDDPDGVCASKPTWAGHHRGKNGTEETVICPLSFELRRPLSSVCNLGYTVAGSPSKLIWGTDILHRLLHVPTISGNVVDHYAEDGYTGVLDLAKKDPSKSTKDSNALQYFAIDVWAYDIAAPGVGCTGKPVTETKA